MGGEGGQGQRWRWVLSQRAGNDSTMRRIGEEVTALIDLSLPLRYFSFPAPRCPLPPYGRVGIGPLVFLLLLSAADAWLLDDIAVGSIDLCHSRHIYFDISTLK